MIKKIIIIIKQFIAKNLEASFIIGFQILILLCSSLLIIGNTAMADDIAICACFSLVIGIILQAIRCISVKKSSDDPKSY